MLSYTELCDLLNFAAGKEPAGALPDVRLMAEIACAESGGYALKYYQNTDGSIDRGLWQINSRHSTEFPDLGDFKQGCYLPLTNARMAIRVWRKQGYKAWSTYNRCL